MYLTMGHSIGSWSSGFRRQFGTYLTTGHSTDNSFNILRWELGLCRVAQALVTLIGWAAAPTSHVLAEITIICLKFEIKFIALSSRQSGRFNKRNLNFVSMATPEMLRQDTGMCTLHATRHTSAPTSSLFLFSRNRDATGEEATSKSV